MNIDIELTDDEKKIFIANDIIDSIANVMNGNYTGPYKGGQQDVDKLKNLAFYASAFGANNTAKRLDERANNIQQDYNKHIANGDHLKREKSGNNNWYSEGVYWN